MTGLRQKLALDFVPEWCALVAAALLVLVWSAHIGLDFTASRAEFLIPALVLAAMLGLRLLQIRRGGLIAEYFCLTLAASTALCALSYLCLASSHTLTDSLADSRLMAIDQALGFNWLTGYRFVQSHPALSSLLGLAYDSLAYQGLYCCLLLGLMNQRQRLREMFWLFLVAGAFACAGALLLPALGPSNFYNIGTATSFVPVMQQLLAGRDLSFALSHLTGVVSFPSFHTSMALAYIWVFRKTGAIGAGIMALNLVMLCAVPWFGGHYLVDMIAGTATMLLSLALVKSAPLVWKARSSGERAVVATATA